MNPALEWGIPIIVGILTFFGGRVFERRRIANQNRLELLVPVEEWIDKASRLKGIVGDDLSAISQGLPLPVGYSPKERIETARAMSEGKEKVLGILNSRALSTRSTNKLASELRDRVIRLDDIIERQYLQIHRMVMDKLTSGQDPLDDIMALLQITTLVSVIIQHAHGNISELKTKLN